MISLFQSIGFPEMPQITPANGSSLSSDPVSSFQSLLAGLLNQVLSEAAVTGDIRPDNALMNSMIASVPISSEVSDTSESGLPGSFRVFRGELRLGDGESDSSAIPVLVLVDMLGIQPPRLILPAESGQEPAGVINQFAGSAMQIAVTRFDGTNPDVPVLVQVVPEQASEMPSKNLNAAVTLDILSSRVPTEGTSEGNEIVQSVTAQGTSGKLLLAGTLEIPVKASAIMPADRREISSDAGVTVPITIQAVPADSKPAVPEVVARPGEPFLAVRLILPQPSEPVLPGNTNVFEAPTASEKVPAVPLNAPDGFAVNARIPVEESMPLQSLSPAQVTRLPLKQDREYVQVAVLRSEANPAAVLNPTGSSTPDFRNSGMFSGQNQAFADSGMLNQWSMQENVAGTGLYAPGAFITSLSRMETGTPLQALSQPGQAVFNPEQMVASVVRGAQFIFRQGESSAVIRLEPPSLGKLKLEITTDGQQVAAKMTVQSAEVRDLILGSLSHLKESLNQNGLTIHSFDVQVGNHDGRAGSDMFRWQAESFRQSHPEPVPEKERTGVMVSGSQGRYLSPNSQFFDSWM